MQYNLYVLVYNETIFIMFYDKTFITYITIQLLNMSCIGKDLRYYSFSKQRNPPENHVSNCHFKSVIILTRNKMYNRQSDIQFQSKKTVVP